MCGRHRRKCHHSLLVPIGDDETTIVLTTRVVYDLEGASRRCYRVSTLASQPRDQALRDGWWRTPPRRSLPVSPASTYCERCGTRAQAGVRRARANGDHAGCTCFATAFAAVL